MRAIHFRACCEKDERLSSSARSGFSFIEIMGALLIFSLLGTTLIVAQGGMMRAVSRIVHDIESLIEGRLVLARAMSSSDLFLKKEEETKTVSQRGPLTDLEYQLIIQAFDKEGLFKDFVPGQYGRVMVSNPFISSSEELFVFILGPNYIQPVEKKSATGQAGARRPIQEPKKNINNAKQQSRKQPGGGRR